MSFKKCVSKKVMRVLVLFQDVFEQFFQEKIEPENVLWNGLLYTFVGLGALATMAAVS